MLNDVLQNSSHRDCASICELVTKAEKQISDLERKANDEFDVETAKAVKLRLASVILSIKGSLELPREDAEVLIRETTNNLSLLST